MSGGPLGARRVDSIDIEVGDDLLYLGKPMRIVRMEPYDTTALLGKGVDGARVAYIHNGWTVTLLPGQGWWVA